MTKSAREVILGMIRAWYDAGHIVNLNADVMAHKLADAIELHWDQFGHQRSAIPDDCWDDEPDSGSPYCECGNSPIEDELANNSCFSCGKDLGP